MNHRKMAEFNERQKKLEKRVEAMLLKETPPFEVKPGMHQIDVVEKLADALESRQQDPPALRCGEFILRQYDKNSLWIENKDGEGMQIFAPSLEKFWTEGF